jgi:hypothetical protein
MLMGPYCHNPIHPGYIDSVRREVVCRELGHDVEELDERVFEAVEKEADERGEIDL